MRTKPLVAVFAATLLGCPPADTAADARQAIDANNADWAQLTSAGQADSLADFFHPNAVLYPPNTPPVRGRDSIRAFYAGLSTFRPSPTLDVRAESVWAGGPTALELGRWTLTWPQGVRRPPGVPATNSGSYFVRWAEEGGRWLRVHYMWNSEIPRPQ
jgi:ketosteroid isomerase-like protein